MELHRCEKCGKQAAEGVPRCPDCVKAAGVSAAEELRDIARVLSITAGTDGNIRDALAAILNIADKLERGK